MIIGENRLGVITRIRTCYEEGRLNDKVELNDPQLSPEESKRILSRFLAARKIRLFPLLHLVANMAINVGQWLLFTKDVKIEGREKLEGMKGGAIVTSNHFSQFENCILRHLAIKQGRGTIHVVSQLGNLEIPGILGFLLRNTDLLPLASEASYMHCYFEPTMQKILEKGGYVLIYPEAEMWWGWRRPRPCRRGAYYYACLLHKPVISCFVEIRDRKEMDKPPFHKVRYTLHILGILTPPRDKGPREASLRMAEQDYLLKKEAYERIYHKKIDAPFSSDDIAGWDGSGFEG